MPAKDDEIILGKWTFPPTDFEDAEELTQNVVRLRVLCGSCA